MQKSVLIAVALVGTLTAGFFLLKSSPAEAELIDLNLTSVKNAYSQWKTNYKVNIGGAEDGYRFKVFTTNYEKIIKHNAQKSKTYSLGLNQFTHLTKEEFAATRLGLRMPKTLHRNVVALPTKNLKASVDWRGKMNAVKNQGQCGSCWAFSAIGAVEGAWNIKSGKLLNLSEQELVDCSKSYGNNGCNGGLMDYAFKYIIAKKGIATEAAYPYKGVDGSCKSGLARNAPITGFADVTANSAAALKAALNKQPVSVAIEADTSIFQSYSSGVITSASCGTNLDHGVVAVGYNDSDKTPYYIVRNSWGTSWGDKGYVKIGIKDGAGICGIQMAASYPTA